MTIFSRILWQLVDFSLLSSSFSIASAVHEHIQQPIFSHDGDTGKDVMRGSRWNFNFTSSAPHYFASVYGLLQQWPQTFFPNGHSIVPCELPPLTKLYHGRRDGDVPPSPEWVAFDMYVHSPSTEIGCVTRADQLQRHGIRHHGLLSQFPHANVSNDSPSKMYLL